ncbi:MAG TPA: PBP1A family penicillin-binding protein [Candidatus Paceibacterota bacterium]|nr:PBP1A family penicillin-binding protein [Candidatus Paceibacterota bacterium]
MTRRKKSFLSHYLNHPSPIAKALFVLSGVVLVGFGIGLLWVALEPVPDLNTLSNRKVTESTRILDRTGQTVLHDLNPDVTRSIVPLSDISPNIQEATIAIEDSAFYYHNGISIPAIIRAVIADTMIFLGLSDGYTQGGSTLTQQVVKNTLLTPEKSIVRKMHEWVLAIKLEQRYTKEEILALYFNNTPYGGTLYGIEAAARAFFGKSAKDVSIAEAAYLAAVPQAPTYYSPYGNNREALENRKNQVLSRMRSLGYITEAEYEAARNEEVIFSPQDENSIIAPHFVFYIEQYLEDKYGPAAVAAGMDVITTLDVDLQRSAEGIVKPYALENQSRFNASNAALVAIDPKTGQILAMVGSRDYFDKEIQGSYNIALAERQPGSSFKPFVYATALAKGYTPETVVFDLPTQFSTACSPADIFNSTFPCYSPSNYDDKFRGPMNLTTAIAQSINIPAVKVMYLAGIDNVIDLASKMGITTLGEAKQYGLSLALGAAEVKLLDLTSAYATFANDGVRNEPTGILKVVDHDTGKVLEEFEAHPEQVLDPGVARDLSYMLSNNEARFPEYPPNNPFFFEGFDVAAKTGTTNDYRDAWTIGYTPSIAVGVWAGNNDNSPMVKEIAGYIVAPMWRQFMEVALQKFPKEYFGERRTIPENAPAALRGVYTDGSGIHDILHFVNKDDPLRRGTSRGDQQYPYWEYSLHADFTQGTTTPSTENENEDEDQEEDRERRNRNNDN